MLKLILIIFILNYFILQVNLTKVDQLIMKLSESAIEIDCDYTMGDGEKKTGLSISKDGQTFLHYDDDNVKDAKYTMIPGVTLIKAYSGCRIDILNYNSDSMGIYELQIFYNNKKGKPCVAKKLYRTSMKYSKCKYDWVNATTGNVPKEAFVAAKMKNMRPLVLCRTPSTGDVGYYDSSRGCVYTNAKRILAVNNFQVVIGSGFSWAKHKGFSDRPSNVMIVGKDNTDDVCLGRCNNHGSAFIGKITDGFYYNYQEKEVDDCEDSHDILLC